MTANHDYDWLLEQALPFWAEHSWDAEHGGHYAMLSSAGLPDASGAKATLVQARMIYVYALAAAETGQVTWLTQAERALDYMLGRLRSSKQGGFVKAVGRDGDRTAPEADLRCDAYDHAFVLLALGALYRARPTPGVLALMDQTWACMMRDLADPATGAFFEDDIRPLLTLPRRQNPHMHLFEACLEVHAATSDRTWLVRAESLLDLFSTYFFDAATGTVIEFLDTELRPAPGRAGQVREPGHHFEWVWLLHRYAKFGDRPVEQWIDRLYAFGQGQGTVASGPLAGLVLDEVLSGLGPVRPTMLLWPQTEGIKAHLALFERTADRRYLDRAAALKRRMFETYCAQALPIWRNQIDEAGATLQPGAPTRLLYHVALALFEFRRVEAAIDPPRA